MSGVIERFTVASGRCDLMVRHDAPTADAFPGAGVVLVHGLLASADIFDVPGLEAVSPPTHSSARACAS